VLLDEAGFGVLLPSWWDRRRKLGLALSAYSPVEGVVTKASKFGRNQLVEFRWDLAVGENTLTEDEIATLAETKAPLIRLRGQWVAVDPEQLRRGLEFLACKPTGRMTAAEILTLAASHPDDIDTPLELTSVRAEGWLGELLSGTTAQSLRPLEPRPGSQRHCAPTSSAGCRGWRSCPRSGWVVAWPTTWAWARPCNCWPWNACNATRTPAPGPCC
jgi:hypothetical protein